MDTFVLQQVFNGLAIGCTYALLAIGLTLIYGTLNAVNIAHGEVYMCGAMAAIAVIALMAPPLWTLFLIVLLLGGVMGVGIELLAFRPFRRFRDEASLASRTLAESTLLSSLALGWIIRESLAQLVQGRNLPVPDAYLLNRPLRLGSVDLVVGDLVIMGTTLVVLGLLQWLLRRTVLGREIRAVAANRFGALHVGVNVNRTITASFVIGSALAAMAGFVVALYYGQAFAYMGFSPLLKAFVAMVMGGLTSIPGAVLAALILGLAEALGTTYVSSSVADVAAFILLLVTLTFFPKGLLGGR